MEEHGGVWVDFTTIFVEELKWLDWGQLVKDENVQNRDLGYSLEPDVFMFYVGYHQYINSYEKTEGGLGRNHFPGYENWFIAAKKNAEFIQDWKKMYI